MPKCLNNPNKFYKGTEPSPKGLGYCASDMKVDKKKVGKDGNMWIVKKLTDGSKRWIKNNEELKKIKHTGYKRYYTHHNGSRPYLVYLGKEDAFIYEIPQDMEIDNLYSEKNDDKNRLLYIKLVKHIKFIKSFVGKSPINKMTKFSAGYGKYFDGNSILLQKNKDTYIFIGHMIKEFKVNNDDIIKFVSPVGNNDVPYPYAIGNTNIYSFVVPDGYLPIKFFTNIKKDDLFNCELTHYDPFFIPFGKKKSIHKISLDEFKKIQKKELKDISADTIKILAKMYNVTTSGSKITLVNRIEKVRRVNIYNKNSN